METNVFKIYKGLPKGVYAISLAKMINAMGTFVLPFSAMFLTQNLHMSEKWIGIFFLILGYVFVPSSLLGGKLVDLIGGKKVFIIAQILSATCYIPCAFLGSSIIIPCLLILSRFFGGIAQPASGAILVNITNEKNRKESFALPYLSANVGIAIGPMLAGFLYNNYIAVLFLGDAFTTILSVIFIGIYIDEMQSSSDGMQKSLCENNDEIEEKVGFIKAIIKRPQLLMFSIVSIIYSFVYCQRQYIIPIQVNMLYGFDGPRLFGFIMSINAITVILATTFISKITKNLDSVLNVGIAGLFYAIGFGILYFPVNFYIFIISTIIWTFGEIISSINTGVYIANHSPASHVGRFNAIIPMISGIGAAGGPIIIGIWIGGSRIGTAWFYIFILAIISSVSMFCLYFIERNQLVNAKKGS